MSRKRGSWRTGGDGAAGAEEAPAKIVFSCYAPVGFGEELVVTGDTLILGRDDPELGVKLRTSPTTYPIWTCAEPVRARGVRPPPPPFPGSERRAKTT